MIASTPCQTIIFEASLDILHLMTKLQSYSRNSKSYRRNPIKDKPDTFMKADRTDKCGIVNKFEYRMFID
jgi:hypothetical protein